ncbi:hypothetical protein ACHAP8_007209 [Fusarium lateritium]
MSQQKMNDSSGSGQTTPQVSTMQASYNKECVVFFGDCGHVLAGHKAFGTSSKLTSKLGIIVGTDHDPSFRFVVDFPLGDAQSANEDVGFGVKHQLDHTSKKVLAFDYDTLEVHFPRGQTQLKFDAVPQSVVDRFQVKNKDRVAIVRVSVQAPVTVVGFGSPFRSSDAEVNGWVNDNKPIGEGGDLQSFLRQDKFTFLISERPVDLEKRMDLSKLPPPFRFPYSDDQSWDEQRLAKEADLKGHQFQPRLCHSTDLSHVTAVVQGTAQDIMWLDARRKEIAATKFSGYFVTPPDGKINEARSLYLVVALPSKFMKDYEQAWRRLSKGELVNVALFGSPSDDKEDESWQAKIMTHPKGMSKLSEHPVEDHELVLLVQTRMDADSPFENCVSLVFDNELPDHKRKVKAANLFCSDADPVNFDLLGLPANPDSLKYMMDEEKMTGAQKFLLAQVRDRMDLHRALVRGEGFYQWMSKPAPRDVEQAMEATKLEDAPVTIRPLPVVNFLHGVDKEYADAIVDEALPGDRTRFRAYLEHRPLGLGIATAGPGFGKTTFGAAATLAMEASLGRIFCSAPTNVAVDNLASRIDKRTAEIAARCNDGKQVGEAPRVLRRLVVRAYNRKHEVTAFGRLLQDPSQGDSAAPRSFFSAPSKWKLHLSSAYWLLMLLRSPMVRPLHQDDAPILHRLQEGIDKNPDLADLRALVTKAINWEAFKATKGYDVAMATVGDYLNDIPGRADILCATPAGSENDKRALRFKLHAKGFAVDEAANMTRPDLYCVWGNTLSPLFVFGDPKQLRPAVMMLTERWPRSGDGPDEFINRFALDAQISALEYLQASGIPTYRLKTQLRMAKGMFDNISDIIYPEVPFMYGDSRDIEFSEFDIGLALESFARARYPDLGASPAGKLMPFFIHCEGAEVFKDKKTGSKRSVGQVTIALDFILDFVVSKKFKPSRISLIAPYAANVDLIEAFVKRDKYKAALATMPPPSTIDSYQGQENDVIVAVVGTDERSGPGFTADARRLNVMLTRAKCGLVVVGNIHVGDAVPRKVDEPQGEDKGKGKGKGKAKGKAKGKGNEPVFTVETTGGGMAMVKAPELRKFYKELHDAGRVAKVVVAEKGKAKDKTKEVKEAKEAKEDAKKTK